MMAPSPAPFGLSTHLFHGERLERRHLERMAAAGFALVELFATRTHLDYHDARALDAVAGWLGDLGMTAASMHAPITVGLTGGVWGRAYSVASSNAVNRHEAVDETILAIDAARQLGCAAIVLHLGIPRGQPIAPGDNDVRALRQSLEPIAEACTRAGVRLALEVIPNDLATPDALLDWLDGDLELGNAAVCLDFGHAHLVGGAPEAVEALGGYIITTHVHDNRGEADDHLIPFDGTIDWPLTIAAMAKVGYDGPWIFELPDHGDAERVLAGAGRARRRIQAILDDSARPFEFEEPS
jgi:sugar phosphate isomerase/epimerase